jgi:hypothetical protein
MYSTYSTYNKHEYSARIWIKFGEISVKRLRLALKKPLPSTFNDLDSFRFLHQLLNKPLCICSHSARLETDLLLLQTARMRFEGSMMFSVRRGLLQVLFCYYLPLCNTIIWILCAYVCVCFGQVFQAIRWVSMRKCILKFLQRELPEHDVFASTVKSHEIAKSYMRIYNL